VGQGDGDLLEGVLERAIPLRPQALGDLALDAGHRGVDSGPLLQAKRGRYDELRPPIGGIGLSTDVLHPLKLSSVAIGILVESPRLVHLMEFTS